MTLFSLYRGLFVVFPREANGVTYSTGFGFGLFYFVTAPTFTLTQKSETDTCSHRCRGLVNRSRDRLRRIQPRLYFAATPTEVGVEG
ncbi:MAG: hypothetical protein ACR2OK_05855, partial [Parvibaculales bacterium]